MSWIDHAVAHAPEAFLLLAIALGTVLGRIRIRGFAIGATACTLLVAVIIGQLGPFNISPMLRSILFGLFVFTIGYRSGPEFFASLSYKTLAQVVLALVIGLSGLTAVLAFAFLLRLDPGTAAGLGAGALTQSSMMGTATGALSQLGLTEEVLRQEQANIAAGYAVTYICGYILVLLFVPLVAPRLMGVDLKKEAAKLEAELAGGAPPKRGNMLYRRLQARAYCVSVAAGRTIAEVEDRIGQRVAIERLFRDGAEVEIEPDTALLAGDELLLAGATAAILAGSTIIGPEIEGEHLMRDVPGEAIDVYVTAAKLHDRTLAEIADHFGDEARGVFLRAISRHGQEVPVAPGTRLYVGDVITLVGLTQDLHRVAPKVGQTFSSNDRTDIAFLACGLAVGLLAGLLSTQLGPVPLTLGGGGGALIAGLLCGWLRSLRPMLGAFPPAAQQTIADLGLSGFVAAIGLGNGLAALTAIQANGSMLLIAGLVVTLTPMIIGTLFAYHILRMNPVIICGALAGAMTVDAAVTGCCEVAESQTPVLGVAVPYAIANVFLTVLGPIIIGLTLAG